MPQNTPEYPPVHVEVKVYPTHRSDTVLANVSATIDGCFAIRGIRVVNGSNGPFVAMPQRQVRTDDGTKYRDICFPCTKEFRRTFDQTVLDAYRQQMAEPQWTEPQAPAPEEAAPWSGPEMNM